MTPSMAAPEGRWPSLQRMPPSSNLFFTRKDTALHSLAMSTQHSPHLATTLLNRFSRISPNRLSGHRSSGIIGLIPALLFPLLLLVSACPVCMKEPCSALLAYTGQPIDR